MSFTLLIGYDYSDLIETGIYCMPYYSVEDDAPKLGAKTNGTIHIQHNRPVLKVKFIMAIKVEVMHHLINRIIAI